MRRQFQNSTFMSFKFYLIVPLLQCTNSLPCNRQRRKKKHSNKLLYDCQRMHKAEERLKNDFDIVRLLANNRENHTFKCSYLSNY
jgi:hypothetical protein